MIPIVPWVRSSIKRGANLRHGRCPSGLVNPRLYSALCGVGQPEQAVRAPCVVRGCAIKRCATGGQRCGSTEAAWLRGVAKPPGDAGLASATNIVNAMRSQPRCGGTRRGKLLRDVNRYMM
jgi:hypothetical protein